MAVNEGKPFNYLPDVAGRWVDGSPVLAEAGLLERKTTEESRAAFDAARRLLAGLGTIIPASNRSPASRPSRVVAAFTRKSSKCLWG